MAKIAKTKLKKIQQHFRSADSKAYQLIEFISNNPNSTADEIHEALGYVNISGIVKTSVNPVLHRYGYHIGCKRLKESPRVFGWSVYR